MVSWDHSSGVACFFPFPANTTSSNGVSSSTLTRKWPLGLLQSLSFPNAYVLRKAMALLGRTRRSTSCTCVVLDHDYRSGKWSSFDRLRPHCGSYCGPDCLYDTRHIRVPFFSCLWTTVQRRRNAWGARSLGLRERQGAKAGGVCRLCWCSINGTRAGLQRAGCAVGSSRWFSRELRWCSSHLRGPQSHTAANNTTCFLLTQQIGFGLPYPTISCFIHCSAWSIIHPSPSRANHLNTQSQQVNIAYFTIHWLTPTSNNPLELRDFQIIYP